MKGIEKVFKLQSTRILKPMFLLDSKGRLKKFDCVEDVLKEFFPLRREIYEKRKENLAGLGSVLDQGICCSSQETSR